jgi:predicted DNA-binding transcriptional regulator YafY
MRENRLITFDYKGSWDERFKPRRVRPYQLLFDNGMWFLYGYAEERRAIRMFSLVRMKNTILTEDTFTLPPDYDYCSRSDGSSFGVFAGEKKYRFSIAFYDESVQWVKERQWAADQKIEESDDDTAIITFASTQYYKVLEWMLSRGCTARPLEPAVLVKDWKNHISKMAELTEVSL